MRAEPIAICCEASDVAPMARSEAEAIARGFKALADPARVQLLNLVTNAANSEACVCDLTAAVGLSQPTISHHLKVLVEAGLLERERRGTWAWYRVSRSRLVELSTHLGVGAGI